MSLGWLRSQSRKMRWLLCSQPSAVKKCAIRSRRPSRSKTITGWERTLLPSSHPPASKRWRWASKSAPSQTRTARSMIGFAARPGTDVEPMCSTSQTLFPSFWISSAAASNWLGQDGSYGTSTVRTLDPAAVEPLPGRGSSTGRLAPTASRCAAPRASGGCGRVLKAALR